MTAAKCALTVHGSPCPNPVAGQWATIDGWLPLCEPCRAAMQASGVDWRPDPTAVAIADRLQRMAAGYFG